MKVFVVDDSGVIRGRLKRLLAQVPNLQVVGEAGDGQATLAAILEPKPDVVLLDIHILNGDGIDVVRRLKQARAAPAVIVLTDYPFPGDRRLCMAAGADFFFLKSTEFDQVVPAMLQLARKNNYGFL